jgi:hypothetical protein
MPLKALMADDTLSVYSVLSVEKVKADIKGVLFF